MATSLIWAETALRDLEAIVAFVALDSPHYAAQTAERIIGEVEPLAQFPRLGRVVPEYEDPNLREIFWRQYRIVYALSDDSVCIVAVVHGSRRMDTRPAPGE